MARVTIEDCYDKVDNVFDIVVVCAHRAKQIKKGDEPYVSVDNDKPTVIAIRELASDKIDAQDYLEKVSDTFRLVQAVDDVVDVAENSESSTDSVENVFEDVEVND